MTNMREVPVRANRLFLDDSVPTIAEEGGITLNAYSGEVIPDHWYYGNLALDLAGLQARRQRMPILLDHDSEKRVGWTESVEVGESGVAVTGRLLKRGIHAQAVLQDAQDGFPWQASVRHEPTEIEDVARGETVTVNGHALVGPGTIIRKARLREVSVTALGADEMTDANMHSDSERQSITVAVREREMAKKPNQLADPPPAEEPEEAAANEEAPTGMTEEQLRSEYPDIIARIEKAAEARGMAESAKADVDRAEEIAASVSESGDAAMLKLALQHIAQRTPVRDALKAITQAALDPKRRAQDVANQLDLDEPIGGDAKGGKLTRTRESLKDEWKAMSAAQRHEWRNREYLYAEAMLGGSDDR